MKQAHAEVESARARKAFATYLDMDPSERTLEKCASLVGVHPVTVRTWAGKFKWRERTSAYDIALSEQTLERAREEALRDKIKRQKNRYYTGNVLIARGMRYIHDHEVEQMHPEKGRLAVALIKYGEESHRLDDGLLEQKEEKKETGESLTIRIIREVEDISPPTQREMINVTPHEEESQETDDQDPTSLQPYTPPTITFSRENKQMEQEDSSMPIIDL